MNPSDDPHISICMATLDPPPELFRRQLDSIRAQSYENWSCLICDDDSDPESVAMIGGAVGDDPRFRVERNPRRLGVYRNFERLLGAVPPDAELVALADQDDRWEPDKLASLRERIGGGVTLAYSDMRVTEPSGEVISSTFWTARRNNPDDLGALVIANSITGGAVLFRRDLLPYALPFPDPGGLMHDHWLAMVAMSLGEVSYVDRPLYDYVQHPGAALGHESVRRARQESGGLKSFMRRGHDAVLGVRVAAEELQQRGGQSIPARKRRVLRRLARIQRSPACWAWLVSRMAGSPVAGSKTMGAERFLLAGLAWGALGSASRSLRLPSRQR